MAREWSQIYFINSFRIFYNAYNEKCVEHHANSSIVERLVTRETLVRS